MDGDGEENQFKCHKCDKSFKFKHELYYHTPVHDVLEFKCSECDKKFVKKMDFYQHMRSHHKDNIFRCCTCDEGFHLKANLQRHFMTVHTSLIPNHCTKCGESCRTKKILDEHIAVHHNVGAGENKFKCHKCYQKFGNGYLLLLHIKTHLNDKKFPCSTCGEKFRSEQKLQLHVMVVHTSIIPHHCTKCGESCRTKKNLDEHMAVHHNGMKFQCESCAKFFPNLWEMYQHQADKHSESNEVDDKLNSIYPCPIPKSKCEKMFTGPGLNTKKRKHPCKKMDSMENQQNTVFNTLILKKKAAQKLSLQHNKTKEAHPSAKVCYRQPYKTQKTTAHVELQDNTSNIQTPQKTDVTTALKCEDEQFKCHKCDKSFKFKHQLYCHSPVHDVLEFKCSKCDKSFKFKHLLDCHSPVHDVLEFKCSKCDKKFVKKMDFYQHMRSHHNDNIFRCSTCGEKFRSKSNLQRHVMVVHTSLIPNHCTKCGESCRTKKKLDEHMAVHHNVGAGENN